jgi:hypothetical protein
MERCIKVCMIATAPGSQNVLDLCTKAVLPPPFTHFVADLHVRIAVYPDGQFGVIV